MICFAATGSASASMPATLIGAGVGPQQAGDHAQGRGLAGAVRAEQRVELAGAHGEIEAVDRGAVEAFDETADLERERFWGHDVLHGCSLDASGQRFRPRESEAANLRHVIKALCGRSRPDRPPTSAQPTAAMFCSTCSGRVAPAMMLGITAGSPASSSPVRAACGRARRRRHRAHRRCASCAR